MAGQTPNHPRPRLLIALAVLASAALAGFVLSIRSEAATTPATETHIGWYGIVRESVEIVMDVWVRPN
ncbi:hypothetical protein [Actinoplanes sp. M2I2]|uniref:hypothetical protein n=1 Tax=Actinoplanes sp. M2I2 TaxID=1734444 RepID=UPI00201FD3B4|nr:hypothetical protein [Actinoplanes sp. M2I2]